ncbi:MAG: DUF2914 domain-containing protein [Elusimicrobia bacterium]|nr:DUF2914 domain-containing protein [Elusimicrobiota bacterium]
MKKTITAASLFLLPVFSVFAQEAPKPQAPETPQAQQVAATEIKVEKIATAASVENREPVGETATFDKAAERVYTWTKITAANTPVTIKHVYYFGEKKECEVELSIKSSPYRVWSSKAVRPGNWKVDVTDETGKVLSTASFSVSPEKPAEPAKETAPAQPAGK